ncbi:SPFH domain-containing protein [Thermodesulfitimonas autotrophica]|uniref:SPFH domain-containing protein n=1 Tax=Thermodesulfitimonas autotrophica TaxID=1894989 RepID=A0A3N5AXI1_9THEO|nr:prohibitin family protein [Thermodesulfitimonas autotrophica]RPF49603.1 SPFH domain-containing protein [Thermodesulfitimonas autotrophica]
MGKHVGQFKIVAGLVGLLLLLTVFRFWAIVPAGHVGVLLQFGAVKGSLGEGFHLRAPLVQKVALVDVRVQKAEADAAAASRDLQTVTSRIAVNYHVRPDAAARLYERVGMSYPETVIAPAVQESVKAVTAKYTAEELITRRREVSSEVQVLLADRLAPYGIRVDGFNIVNFDFSAKFNEAVEEKLAAEQRALKARRDLERIKIEAEQKVTQAKAEAEALRIQRQQVTPELLRLREIEVQKMAVEKWDGRLPQVTGGAMPFVDLRALSQAQGR